MPGGAGRSESLTVRRGPIDNLARPSCRHAHSIWAARSIHMARLIPSVLTLALVLGGGALLSAQNVQRSALHDYRLVPYAEGLVQPWAITFLPGGDALITERPGRLRIVRNGKLLSQPVEVRYSIRSWTAIS